VVRVTPVESGEQRRRVDGDHAGRQFAVNQSSTSRAARSASSIVPSDLGRGARPGLWTSLVLFLPLGLGLLVFFWPRVDSSLLFVVLGFAIAIAEHAGIVVYAIRRRRAYEIGIIAARPLDRTAPVEVQ
jgi:hypothetical protein